VRSEPVSPTAIILTDKNQSLAATCWVTTAILAGFMCFTQVGMMLSLMLGRIGLAGVAPAALVAALLVGDRLAVQSGLAGRERWRPQVLTLGTLAVALAFSAWYFDLSFDGEWYHQAAIYAIARDWNPLADPMHGFISHLELWVRHYAKGPWYVAAAIYNTTGLIEMGKCPALLAWAASGLAVFAAGLDWGLRRWPTAAIALVVALNPVITSELTTYLVDGIMIGFLVVVVAVLFSGLRRPQPVVVWVGVLATIACINAKFTGLVFLCFVFGAAWIWCALQRREWLRRYTGWAALTLLLGTVVLGYNPYVTNTIHRHQPFYPVLGSAAFPSLTTQGREGITRSETPKNLLGHGRLYRMAFAIFGRPGNAPYGGVRNAELMWPLAARWADLFFYRYHETRVAGFGPFLSGALIIGFALGVWLLFQPGRARWAAVLSVLTIGSSLAISLHLWWPRYGPQLWLLPIVPVIFVIWGTRSRWAHGAAWVLVALLVVNAAVVAGVRMKWETLATLKLRQQLTELSQPGKEIEVSVQWFEIGVPERLKAWGVHFQTRPRNFIRDGEMLMSVVDRYPGAVRYRMLPTGPTGASR
jgi:hypothetical protein